MIGNEIHDPCFAPATVHPRVVYCIESVRTRHLFAMTLTRSLPRNLANTAADAAHALPSSIELIDGTSCDYTSGATGVVAGRRVNFICGSGRVLLGDPDLAHHPALAHPHALRQRRKDRARRHRRRPRAVLLGHSDMGNGALTIRVAVDSDLAAIVDIYNAAIPTRTATAQLEPVTVEQQTPWFEAHGVRHPIWVACEDDAMAGWLSVTPWSDRTAYDATAEISVYLAPAFHKRGIGARLVRHAIAQAPLLGIDTLIARRVATQ